MIRTRRRQARALLAVLLVVAGLWSVRLPRADADDPVFCGYVKFGTNGTTTTASSIPYCERPCPSGIGLWIPPGHAAGVKWEALVCVLGD